MRTVKSTPQLRGHTGEHILAELILVQEVVTWLPLLAGELFLELPICVYLGKGNYQVTKLRNNSDLLENITNKLK